MKPKPNSSAAKKGQEKSRLHPRNKHKSRYDFKKLITQTPELGEHVAMNKYGSETINFFNEDAVKLLNKSLLQSDYGIEHWNIPDGYLCPPIPGRADYIHHIADLLATDNSKQIPKGKKVECLDVGTGANCIYPIIGAVEYGWRFVATDIDKTSVKTAKAIVEANDSLKNIEVVLQRDKSSCFKHIVREEDYFDLTVCNPPFHASAQAAIDANERKNKNLKGTAIVSDKPSFGGQHNELWCKGGELAFIINMIFESADYSRQVLWFSTLVSKQGHLKDLYSKLRKVDAVKVETLAMGQGNKSSRILAWTFKDDKERQNWWKGLDS